LFLAFRSDLELEKPTHVRTNDKDFLVILFDDRCEVYDKQCPHKSFDLTKEDFCDKKLVCPYHGILQKPKVVNLRPNDTIIFTDEAIETVPLKHVHTNTMPVRCNFSHWLINTMDFNHVRTVHKDTLAKSFTNEIKFNNTGHAIKLQPEVYNRLRKFYGNCDDIFKHALIADSLSSTRFANLFFSFESCIQNGSDCIVQTRFFVRKLDQDDIDKGYKIPRLLIDSYVTNALKILDEDKSIVERWAFTGGLFTQQPMNNEHLILAYEERLRG
jgi:hypothetical protein